MLHKVVAVALQLRDHPCVSQGRHSPLLLPVEPPAQGKGRC